MSGRFALLTDDELADEITRNADLTEAVYPARVELWRSALERGWTKQRLAELSRTSAANVGQTLARAAQEAGKQA